MDATKARRFYDECLKVLYTERNVDRMDEFYAQGVVAHPAPPGLPPGLEGLKLMTRGWLEAFTDSQYTLETFIHDNGQVASRLLVSAVHSGPFLGIAPTGRRVVLVDHPHFRIENGKITEFWHNPDLLALMHQLGALPAPAQAA